MVIRRRHSLLLVFALVLVFASCGTDGETSTETTTAVAADTTAAAGQGTDAAGRLSVVATTTIVGDILSNIVGADAEVIVLLPVGADPHDYQMSAAQVASLHDADLVVASGLLLEEGIHDALVAAEADGVNLMEVGDLLDPLPFAGAQLDEEGDHHEDEDDEGEMDEDHHDEGEMDEDEGEDHHDEGEMDEGEVGDHHDEGDEGEDHHDEGEMDEGEDHDEEEGRGDHDHGDLDPHFWMDPLRVAKAARLIAGELARLDSSIDWEGRADDYGLRIEELDAEIQAILAPIAPDDRKLVTNHDALGYFAARYGFEILDTVIPGGATLADPSSAELAALVETIRHEGVPAIFAETIESTALADALALEAGSEVVVVELYTGSLGEPGSGAETVIGMLRINAQRIAEVLAGG